jgi:hypothetical protein
MIDNLRDHVSPSSLGQDGQVTEMVVGLGVSALKINWFFSMALSALLLPEIQFCQFPAS